MSSILTNNSAMVALQTLKSINNDLSKTQSMISTGKDVASAKDNASVWAISKVMESDVKGFKGISDSLARGESTVSVARQASETITNLLTDIKGKVVAAQEGNTDERAKIQTDIDALTDQIKSVVGAAQLGGVNLIDGSSGDVNFLSSLDRAADGTVTSSSINVSEQDLSIGTYTAKAAFTGSDGASTTGDTFATTLDAADGTGITVTIPATVFEAGDKISITVGDQTVSHTVSAEQISATTTEDLIATSLKVKIDGLGIEGLVVDYDSGSSGELLIHSATEDLAADPPVYATAADLSITGQFTSAGSGGLGALSSIDVNDAAGSQAALSTVENLISTAIDASAAFGSAQGRIEIQSNFISQLSDALESGIGSMVDADMEEASARLQALQVQQQLGIQSLSIANQAPQSILSLFQ